MFPKGLNRNSMLYRRVRYFYTRPFELNEQKMIMFRHRLSIRQNITLQNRCILICLIPQRMFLQPAMLSPLSGTSPPSARYDVSSLKLKGWLKNEMYGMLNELRYENSNKIACLATYHGYIVFICRLALYYRHKTTVDRTVD